MLKTLPLIALAFVASTNVALAAPTNSDASVTLSAPLSVPVDTPTVYTALVKNFGPKTAEGTVLTITLPLTNTSPTTQILGSVSGLSAGCSVANKKIVCSIGNLKNGKSKSVSYTYTAPVANKPLTMTAVVTVTNNDIQLGNNTSSVTPSLAYPDRAISQVSSTAILNAHCTGRDLSSYFECMLYPSSISTHSVVFEANGTITFPEPGYLGTWSQPSLHELHFEYFEGVDKVAEFNGFAGNGNSCFDGITNFFPVSAYNAAYRVCM